MEENNKIIAEFMGFTFEKNIGYYDNEMLLEQIVYEQQNGNCFDELLFNKDWNWLMAVVEKIEECDIVASFQIEQPTIYIWASSESDSFEDIEVDIFDKTKIEAVYEAVVKFINFYNKQKEE